MRMNNSDKVSPTKLNHLRAGIQTQILIKLILPHVKGNIKSWCINRWVLYFGGYIKTRGSIFNSFVSRFNVFTMIKELRLYIYNELLLLVKYYCCSMPSREIIMSYLVITDALNCTKSFHTVCMFLSYNIKTSF